jgi:hypothetical protein
MPIPEWLRELDERERPPSDNPAGDDGELGFWNAPPRYSVTSLSLAPPAPPRMRVWNARLLFGAILCAVVTLLGVEASSFLRGASAMRALRAR